MLVLNSDFCDRSRRPVFEGMISNLGSSPAKKEEIVFEHQIIYEIFFTYKRTKSKAQNIRQNRKKINGKEIKRKD